MNATEAALSQARKVVHDEWDDGEEHYRLVSVPTDPFAWLERGSMVTRSWVQEEDGSEVLASRLLARINVNNVEARRISFLAAALMRVLQLAEKLVDDAPGGLTRLTRGHLAAVKGVLLACKMPLERWQIELDGVKEDPETAEARRRLGLDPPQAASS